MTKAFLLLFSALITNSLFGQDLAPNQLLNKAIAYHDPQGNWVILKGNYSLP